VRLTLGASKGASKLYKTVNARLITAMNIVNLYYLVWTVAGILTAIATALSIRRELRRSRRHRC